MPTKLLFDITKFEGKPRENQSTHIMTYYLWCSSKYLVDDFIKIHLFQHTLTIDATIWYIELNTASYSDFSSLAQAFFLTHFQLPIGYDIDIDLFSKFKQYDATLISDHIHEWYHRKRLVRTKLPDEILPKLFIFSLRPQIYKDVSMFQAISEEKAILDTK